MSRLTGTQYCDGTGSPAIAVRRSTERERIAAILFRGHSGARPGFPASEGEADRRLHCTLRQGSRSRPESGVVSMICAAFRAPLVRY